MVLGFCQFEEKRVEMLAGRFVEGRRPPLEVRDKVDLAFRIEKHSLFIFENYPKEETAADSELETQLSITKKATEEWTTYPLTIMVADGASILIRLVLFLMEK